MANMSASILRNVVASFLGVKAQNIRLSGEMPVNFTHEITTGVAYVTREEDFKMWSWSAKNGFVEIRGCIGGTHYYNGNHDHSYTKPIPLSECVTGDEVFFITKHWGCDDWGTEFCDIDLTKAPDFQKHWEAIKDADVQRWEQWLVA